MSVAGTQIRIERDLPFFWTHARQEIASGWRWCVRVYHHHSDLMFSLSLFFLNTTILVSKIFRQIPKAIPRSAFVALNFSSLIWLNIQIRDLKKTGEDLYKNLLAKDFEGIVFTAAKVAVKALGLLLTGGALTASILALCGFSEQVLIYYAFTRPFALFSLITGIFTEVYDYEKNDALVKQLLKIERTPAKIEAVMNHFRNRLFKVDTAASKDTPEERLARHTFQQLGHDTLELMREEFKKLNLDHSIKLKKALQNHRQFTQANLGLIALGHVALGICRLWPNTLIQSATTWGISLLYTSKLIFQKTRNHKLRQAIPK